MSFLSITPSLFYDRLGLLAYCYGLDNNTMYAYLQAAATEFEKFTLYTTLAIVQQVIIAVAKLPVAKLSDVFGRAEAFCISLFFYVVSLLTSRSFLQEPCPLTQSIIPLSLLSHRSDSLSLLLLKASLRLQVELFFTPSVTLDLKSACKS